MSPYTAENPRRDVFYRDIQHKTVTIVGLGGGGEIAPPNASVRHCKNASVRL